MSVEAMTWAWMQKTGGAASKVVLMALADQAGWDTWQCWPSQKRLAQRCEMSTRSVRRHLDALELRGFIKRRERHRANGGRSSDQYMLLGKPRGQIVQGEGAQVSRHEP